MTKKPDHRFDTDVQDASIAAFMDEVDSAAARREYLGEWRSTKRQCEVRTVSERCPNVAKYALVRDNGDEPVCVCDQCTPTWLHEFTKRGPALVQRLVTITRDRDVL